MVALEGSEEIQDMELTWAGRIQQKSWKEGMREGRLREARQLVLHQLEARFGALTRTTARKVEAIRELAVLRRLSQPLLSAKSLADLDLD